MERLARLNAIAWNGNRNFFLSATVGIQSLIYPNMTEL